MIRSLSFFILLGTCTIVLAEPLYKWVEPDGAITFSVKPPPAGISYETVNAPQPSSSDSTGTANTAKTVKTVKTAEQSRRESVRQTLTETGSSAPTQRVAPQLGVQASSSRGITRTADEKLPATRAPVNGKQSSVAPSSGLNAKSRKQRQCEDLQKRVVSLERRLKTRLTPEDMDNTVVHMARYQRSFDQHCVQ